MPISIKEIEPAAFQQCVSLKYATLPKNIENISVSVFAYCSSLEHVIIPVSVTKISPGAFYGCTALKDVWYDGSKADWRKIKIDDWGNEPLFTAAKLFMLGSVIPLETEPVTPIINEADNTVSFIVTVLDKSRADELNDVELYVAEYDSDGRFIGLTLGTKSAVEGDTVTITADIPETDKYKFLLWDGNNAPLMNAVGNNLQGKKLR